MDNEISQWKNLNITNTSAINKVFNITTMRTKMDDSHLQTGHLLNKIFWPHGSLFNQETVHITKKKKNGTAITECVLQGIMAYGSEGVEERGYQKLIP